jgi:hypothetical protein
VASNLYNTRHTATARPTNCGLEQYRTTDLERVGSHQISLNSTRHAVQSTSTRLGQHQHVSTPPVTVTCVTDRL